MRNRLFSYPVACWLIAGGAAGFVTTASAQDSVEAQAKVKTIAAGSDYLQTNTGTEATLPLNGKMVKVKLTGVPIKGSTGSYGNSDTIVQRTQDAAFSTTTGADVQPDSVSVSIPITITALNMTGTVPGPSGGSCTVTITVAPSPASTGTLTLTKASLAATSGTYTSSVNVYFNATFSPISPNTTCYAPILNAPPCVFNQKGGRWSTTPVAGEFLFTGAYPNLQANQHTSLPPGFADFYMTQPQVDTAATARHATCEALEAAGTACPTTTAR